MKTVTRMLGAVSGFLFLSADMASAQLAQPCSVADGSGARSTGGDLISVTADAQPGGIAVSTAGAIMNYAGFLGCAILRPNLDTDGDGMADEIDPDNDNDWLWDTQELDGSVFGPATSTEMNDPDSDDDGATDGEEAAAQTNPLDITHYLHFTRFVPGNAGDEMTMSWVARSNYLYKVYRVDDLKSGLPGTYVTDVRAPMGGVGLWAIVTATNTVNVAGAACRSYYVWVIGP